MAHTLFTHHLLSLHKNTGASPCIAADYGTNSCAAKCSDYDYSLDRAYQLQEMAETLFIHQNSILNKREAFIRQKGRTQKSKLNYFMFFNQCCGTGIFIPDPRIRIRLFSIQHPGSEFSIPDPHQSI